MSTNSGTNVDFVSLQDYEDAIALLRGDKGFYRDVRYGYLVDGEFILEMKREFCAGFLKDIYDDEQPGPIGKAWLERIIGHLYAKVDRYFREAHIPQDKQQFMAMMKRMAIGYREDAEALDWAAARLLKCQKCGKSDLHGANQTKKAALVAHRAAQELIGEDG